MTETTTNYVRNHSFEEAGGDGQSPPGWTMGFADENADRWAIDEGVSSDGQRSIRLEPAKQCVATQVIDAPVSDLDGKKVTLAVDIRGDKVTAPPQAMLVAFNPDLPDDALLQTGVAGKLQITAARGRDGRFVPYTASFVASGPATSLQVMLIASVGGTVWFDNVRVTIESA